MRRKSRKRIAKNAHAAGKAEADLERFSGDGSAPRRAFRPARFMFSVLLSNEI